MLQKNLIHTQADMPTYTEAHMLMGNLEQLKILKSLLYTEVNKNQ